MVFPQIWHVTVVLESSPMTSSYMTQSVVRYVRLSPVVVLPRSTIPRTVIKVCSARAILFPAWKFKNKVSLHVIRHNKARNLRAFVLKKKSWQNIFHISFVLLMDLPVGLIKHTCFLLKPRKNLVLGAMNSKKRISKED